MIVEVTGETDPRLSDYRNLTDVALRKKTEPAAGLYIAESIKVITRALEAGHQPRSVLVQPEWLGQVESLQVRGLLAETTPIYQVSQEGARRLTGYPVHRGALAAMHRPPLPTVASLVAGAERIMVLEDIVDHTNVGAIFRACAGLGVAAVLVSDRCADPLYRRSVRVSMGTVFQVPWTRMRDWDAVIASLHEAGFQIAALSLDTDAISLDRFSAAAPARLALMVGTEGDGLSRRARAGADVAVTIPMSGGVDSLNVAAATAVALWAVRPHTHPGDIL